MDSPTPPQSLQKTSKTPQMTPKCLPGLPNSPKIGPKGSQIVSNGPKMPPKLIPNWIQIQDKEKERFLDDFRPLWGPKMTPKWSKFCPKIVKKWYKNSALKKLQIQYNSYVFLYLKIVQSLKYIFSISLPQSGTWNAFLTSFCCYYRKAHLKKTL